MINLMRLTNFQSHVKSVLEFHPGLNVIVGPSDSGKSAILRALRWLVTDRPLGGSFRTHGSKSTEVGLVMDDGETLVTRFKSDCKNVYTVGDEGEMVPLSCSSSGPPDAVTKVLNLNELNYQAQLDSPFLLALSPGEAARKLNEVANLTTIDSTLYNVGAKLREAKAAAVAHEARAETLRKEIEGLAWVAKAQREVQRLEVRRDVIQHARQETEAGKLLLAGVARVTRQLDAMPKTVQPLRAINTLMERVTRHQSGAQYVKTMEADMYEVHTLSEQIKSVKKREVTARAEWKRLAPKECPLCGGKLGDLK